MRHVIGLDAGGTKTMGMLADESGRVLASALGGGANLRTQGELGVEKVLHAVLEELETAAGVHADSLVLGMAGADRPDDHAVLEAVLRRIGFRKRFLVTNDARIAFVAGSPSRVGLALVCGTGSIAWGRARSGEIARSGGWGWHVGDEGSGFWIGERAIRQVLRACDGRGPATLLHGPLLEHFGIERVEQIVRAMYDGEYPRGRVATFAVAVERAALDGDGVAAELLESAAEELALAAGSVVERLRLEAENSYDVILSGGSFRAVTTLQRLVTRRLESPAARVRLLEGEPASGALRLALEELGVAAPP